MWAVGHEYAFRSGQPTAQAGARTSAVRDPLEKEADPLSWLVGLLTEANASEGVAAQASDATVTDTARASAPV